MINWLNEEDQVYEGIFNSKFFHNDEDDRLFVYTDSRNYECKECAEKCVNDINTLSKEVREEICNKLIECAKEGGLNEEFELPDIESFDILKYCWFIALYVDMKSKEDAPSYAIEGEGDWGENIGFVISNHKVTYVGTDYLDNLKNPY